MIVDLTERANEELEKIMKGKKEKKALRIHVSSFGWAGPSFGIALDEQKDGDVETEVNGYTFLAEEDLLDSFNKFTIDYGDSMLNKGFTVKPGRG